MDTKNPPASDGSGPNIPAASQPLWKTIEDEFRTIHRDRIDLGEDYVAERDAFIAAECREIAEGLCEIAPEITPEEAYHQRPSLINGAGCRALFKRVHRLSGEGEEPVHTALCISGGGIRSATFALGVLQGLARYGCLHKFAYLSTVSGGGYIGSWLSSWICRVRAGQGGKKRDAGEVFRAIGGIREPLEAGKDPATDTPGDGAAAAKEGGPAKHPFETEPPQIRHLREYSNYLTPKLGLLSGDGWSVLAIVLRNLILNWLVIVPAFLLALLGPRVALAIELHRWGHDAISGKIVAGLAFVSGVIALGNLLARKGNDQRGVLLQCIAPLVFSCATIVVAWFWARTANPEHGFFLNDMVRLGFYVGWGAATGVLAFLWAVVRRKTSGPDAQPLRSPEVRLFSITIIYALAGLLVWWAGGHAADGMRRAHEQDLAFRDAAAAKIVGTLKADNSNTMWTLITQTAKTGSFSTWVQTEVPAALADPTGTALRERFPSRRALPPTGDATRLRVAVNAVCFGFPLLLALIFVASTVLNGVLSAIMLDDHREWYARAAGVAFMVAVMTCAASVLVLWGPLWVYWLWENFPRLISSVGGGAGLITILGGGSENTPGTNAAKVGPVQRATAMAVSLAAPVFIAFLIMAFSFIATIMLQKLTGIEVSPRDHFTTLRTTSLSTLLVLAAGLAVLAEITSQNVNVNKFSLHAMYRNRLIRAYLGATNQRRQPNTFTGFDHADNLPLHRLREQRPFHVINTALNLVSGQNLAWQQRMAESFTMTPLTCGSATLGYRNSADYGRGELGPVSLGTALAISGAAVSPNHGYNSSPVVAFLLTFFNARLGAWLGNTGAAGVGLRSPILTSLGDRLRDLPLCKSLGVWLAHFGSTKVEAWKDDGPELALGSLLAEAVGMTDSTHPFVNLSDGGHFENLGLYEMVLRRCRLIVVCDGGCDTKYSFEDLANAVAKVRVDFGIQITFEPDIAIRKATAEGVKDDGFTRRHCAIGKIKYSDVDSDSADGTLIYIKPALCGREPVDVFHYAREHAEFPHEPTTDQWFSEAQFESYRSLGQHTIDRIMEESPKQNAHPNSELSHFTKCAMKHAMLLAPLLTPAK